MMNEFDFGLLKPWIEDDMVTDINYNGRQCWIDHLKKGRFAPRSVLRSRVYESILL